MRAFHGLLVLGVFQVEAQVFEHHNLVEVMVGLCGQLNTSATRSLPLQTLHHAAGNVQTEVVVLDHVLHGSTPRILVAGADPRLQIEGLETKRRHVLGQERKVHPRIAESGKVGPIIAGVLGLDYLARHLVALPVGNANSRYVVTAKLHVVLHHVRAVPVERVAHEKRARLVAGRRVIHVGGKLYVRLTRGFHADHAGVHGGLVAHVVVELAVAAAHVMVVAVVEVFPGGIELGPWVRAQAQESTDGRELLRRSQRILRMACFQIDARRKRGNTVERIRRMAPVDRQVVQLAGSFRSLEEIGDSGEGEV